MDVFHCSIKGVWSSALDCECVGVDACHYFVFRSKQDQGSTKYSQITLFWPFLSLKLKTSNLLF